MEQKQAFNLSADFLGGFSAIFLKIVFAVIIIYLLLQVLNFLRDKFINNEVVSKSYEITDLLKILNKLFFVSGFGFVISNILQVILSEMSGSHSSFSSMSFRGEWDYLTFGIILIFMGLGFKGATKLLKKD